MSDTDKDKIIALLRDEVKAWRALDVERMRTIMALLRAEVLAWRGGCSPSRAWNEHWEAHIEQAIAATTKAGALEDK